MMQQIRQMPTRPMLSVVPQRRVRRAGLGEQAGYVLLMVGYAWVLLQVLIGLWRL